MWNSWVGCGDTISMQIGVSLFHDTWQACRLQVVYNYQTTQDAFDPVFGEDWRIGCNQMILLFTENRLHSTDPSVFPWMQVNICERGGDVPLWVCGELWMSVHHAFDRQMLYHTYSSTTAHPGWSSCWTCRLNHLPMFRLMERSPMMDCKTIAFHIIQVSVLVEPISLEWRTHKLFRALSCKRVKTLCHISQSLKYLENKCVWKNEQITSSIASMSYHELRT